MKSRRLADENGQLLIITALGLVMLLGITAFSIDAAFMYDKRNRIYAAADAAAKSAAIEVHRYTNPSATVPPLADLQRFADQQVALHGLTPERLGGTTLVEVHHPPINGPFIAPSYVEVIVSEQTSTFFGKLLGRLNMTPGARAVAGTSGSLNCLVVFDHVAFTNPATGSTLDMLNCSLVVGETSGPTFATTDLNNRATISAKSIGVVHSGATGCTGNCGNVTYGIAPPTDPLSTLPPLTDPAPFACDAAHPPFAFTGSDAINMSNYNKYYCGFDIKGSGTPGTILTFAPGEYYINGPITDTGGSTIGLSGDGVMLFLSPTATINWDSSSNVELRITAPISGVYNGILLYQDRNTPINTPAVLGKNNTLLQVRGAFYFPTATVVMSNENSPSMTNPCTLIVAWAIQVDKPHFVLDNACSTFGGSPILTVSIAE